jgi:AraC-like DNA-binding protein
VRTPRTLVVPSDQATLAIWATPRERATLQASLAGRVQTIAIDDLSAAYQVLATGQAHGILASSARLDERSTPQLTRLRCAFPHLPLVGLVTQETVEGVVLRVATLGRLGADPVVDLRGGTSGWAQLSAAADRLPTPVVLRGVAVVQETLGGTATRGWLRFIETIFRGDVTMVRDIARRNGISASTLMSRFGRVGLPSPRKYVEMGFVARFAHLCESTTWSVTAIANAINASSAQALGRTFRRLTGLTPVHWRRQYGLASALGDFRSRFIEPYRDVLDSFDPFRVGR